MSTDLSRAISSGAAVRRMLPDGAAATIKSYPQDLPAIDMTAATYINVCAQNSPVDVPASVATCIRIL